MKVKVTETVQGAGISGVLLHEGIRVNVLEPGESYEVGDTLGAWLIENHKGVEVGPRGGEKKQPKEEVHYGGQKEAELRHDDEKYEQMKAEANPILDTYKNATADEIESAEASDMMTTENQPTRKKRTRK